MNKRALCAHVCEPKIRVALGIIGVLVCFEGMARENLHFFQPDVIDSQILIDPQRGEFDPPNGADHFLHTPAYGNFYHQVWKHQNPERDINDFENEMRQTASKAYYEQVVVPETTTALRGKYGDTGDADRVTADIDRITDRQGTQKYYDDLDEDSTLKATIQSWKRLDAGFFALGESLFTDVSERIERGEEIPDDDNWWTKNLSQDERTLDVTFAYTPSVTFEDLKRDPWANIVPFGMHGLAVLAPYLVIVFGMLAIFRKVVRKRRKPN